jgi:hypothetical protein
MSGFFETMGIPILQGRSFQSTDAVSGGMVAVVNETLANTYWKGRNPIGQQLRPFSTDNGSPWFTVIGVARDVKQSGVDQPPGTQAYLLVDQLATDSPRTWVAISPPTMHIVVRSTLPPATLAPAIARTVHDIDPSIPLPICEMDEVCRVNPAPASLAQLLAAFSALALLLPRWHLWRRGLHGGGRRRGDWLSDGTLRATRVLTDIIREVWLAIASVLAGTGIAVLLNRLIASPFGVAYGRGDIHSNSGDCADSWRRMFLPAWRASRLIRTWSSDRSNVATEES